jgi:transposase
MSDRREALERARLLNPKAQKVRSPLFRHGSFFDSHDKLQTKYEMLRSREVDRVAIQQVAEMFGYSRQGFYQLQEAFRKGGMAGLLEKRRGPKGPAKCTPQIVTFVLAEKQADPALTGRELAERLGGARGVSLHRRTIEKILSAQPRPGGRRKKKRKGMP